MTRFHNKRFTVGSNSQTADDNYKTNYDRIFGTTLKLRTKEEVDFVRSGLTLLRHEYQHMIVAAPNSPENEKFQFYIEAINKLLEQL